IFDTTTNSPELVRRIAAECQKTGVYLLDSPISGGSMGAEAGTLTFMVGGDRAIFDKYQPVLQAMGKNLFYMGDVGAGCAVKLVTQYMGYCNLVTAFEAMLMAKKAGLDLATVYNVVPVSAGNFGLYQAFFRGVFSRNFGTPEAGGVDMIAKDLMLGNELAEAVDSPHRMGANAYAVFKKAQEMDLGGYVLTAAVQPLEQEAGAELEAKLE
ncbi:MAG TPA: NAD(P)-dependent oxidoreductase, partial [Dehalococcoidia bacterium]|nr:NAD(P)-dependent oxidoreductase [Dehalococcoidia bacterium]